MCAFYDPIDEFYDPLEENLNDIDIIDNNIDNENEVLPNHQNLRLPKRYIRDAANPLESYEGREFKRRYRFSKNAVMHGILPHIEAALRKPDRRGLPIAPVIQLLVCLRFYATASFQDVCAELFHISQSTVSRIVFRVSCLLAALMKDIIKMPGENEIIECRRKFKKLGAVGELSGLPGIDGAIDCTHIRLVYTFFQQFQEVYRNRKSYFSLNVQAVVGPEMEFFDIVPEWAGSEHDSRIFQNSRINQKYVNGHLTGTLVGDSGYSCMPYLLTPVLNPQTVPEQRYNRVHVRTRGVVERTFGTWKRRFPCLSRGLANKLLCTTTIIVACAVLHNFSIKIDKVMPEDEFELELDDVPVDPPALQPTGGLARRQALIANLYM